MPAAERKRAAHRSERPVLKKFALSGRTCQRRTLRSVLAAQPQTLDERTVAFDVDVLQVTQQATTLSDEQKQTTT